MTCKQCGVDINEFTQKWKYRVCDNWSKPKVSEEALAKWDASEEIVVGGVEMVVVGRIRTPTFIE